MAFSVKATLVGFAGDLERYPCHAMLEVGEEFRFDGAEFTGKMCPDALPQLMDAIIKVHKAGPRYTDPNYYNLFWYAVNSVADPDYAKYDGNGFKPVNEEYEEPKHHIRDLLPPGGFTWPPSPTRSVCQNINVQCADPRTAACWQVEAYDLATAGYHLPYTRRQFTIMDKIVKAGGTVNVKDIISLYTEDELNNIYPTLVQGMVEGMVEELELLSWVTVTENGDVTVTQAGMDRVARYAKEIPEEHARALGLI